MTFRHPVENRSCTLDDLLKELLEFLTRIPPTSPDWFGFVRTDGAKDHLVDSFRYLAQAIRALSLVPSLRKTPGGTPDLPFETVDALLLELRKRLRWKIEEFSSEPAKALERLEEPPDYVLGETARALLAIGRSSKEASELSPFVPLIQSATEIADQGDRGQISTYYLWPSLTFLAKHARAGDQPVYATRLFQNYRRCVVDNPLWVKSGADTGTWGYNLENTSRIARALTEFWHFALARKDLFEAHFESLGAGSRESPP